MKQLILVVMALFAGSALGGGEDLERCLNRDGFSLPQSYCDELRKEKAVGDSLRQALVDSASGANLEICRWNTGNVIAPDYCEQLRKEKAFKDAEQNERNDRNAKLEREFAEEQSARKKIQQAALKEQEQEEAAHKRKCGKDYMAIRIGMAIGRLEECHGASYVTKKVSKDGVVETYQTIFDMVDVKNGKVVSYTKRRY